MEKCCLLISANESYQMAEKDLEIFTGVKVSHSTLHRLVKRQEFELPTSKQGVQEITLDGGQVRLRNETKGEGCYWKDYKAICLDNVYSGAFFQNNQDLIDWTNSQKLLHPMYCLGDGHAGIWNIFKEIGDTEQRQEILDWYHLKENLYKVGGSLKRLKLAENMLWKGKINEVINLFKEMRKKGFKTFCNYLETHRCPIVNYQYYKEESISSIGSGTVESIIKRIGFRVKISGAQWKIENISVWRMCQKRVKMKKLVKSSNKYKANKMIPSDQQQLKAHLKAVAEIFYRNTDPTELKSFESIEKSLRQKMLEEVGPELGSFFFQQYQEFKQENPAK